MRGGTAAGGNGVAAWTADVINLLQGLPPVRRELDRIFGKKGADFIVNALAITSLALAESPLGLIMLGTEALIMIGEVTARRSAWRRYEETQQSPTSAEAGAMIRLEAGTRVTAQARAMDPAAMCAADV
jgi:hypothetical protein